MAKEWRDGFISATNERVDSLNAEPSTIEASDYSRPSDNTDTYDPEDSNTLADELALTSSSYPVEEPKSSADELVFILFSRLVEDDILANELDHTTYAKPTASKKRPGTGLKKTLSEDPRYGTGTPSRRRQPKKQIRISRTVEEHDFI